MDDRTVIERILAGDSRSFSCLVSKYRQMAYTIAFRVMENREEAEEVTQDAFIKMYRSLSGFQFQSKFSTWFYRIVYHAALSARKRMPLFLDMDNEAPEELTQGEMETAGSILERSDRTAVIHRVLNRLPPDKALLLTLYYLEENTVEEIRQITDWTVSNIKVQLFRARKQFYQTLQKEIKTEIADLL